MNWNTIEGSWKEMKGKVREKWGRLTDDEIDVIAGNREQLEGTLQKKYGKTQDQIRREVDEWVNKDCCV